MVLSSLAGVQWRRCRGDGGGGGGVGLVGGPWDRGVCGRVGALVVRAAGRTSVEAEDATMSESMSLW